MVARAGYCTHCGRDVWLKQDDGCIYGHGQWAVRGARTVPLPAELDRFNWGAFFLSGLWALVHGPAAWAAIIIGVALVGRMITWVVPSEQIWLIAAVGIGQLGLAIWYARNANRLMWEAKPWAVDVPAFLRSQRTWAIAGLCVAVALFLGPLLLGVLLATVT